MTHEKYRSGKLETFDCHFHPERGVHPNDDLRHKVWNAFRERIADYLGPNEFYTELRRDDRFTETERREILWAGVVMDGELRLFRNGSREELRAFRKGATV